MTIDRRHFLGLAAAAVGASTFAGCTSAPPGRGSEPNGGEALLPTYRAFTVVEPDRPAEGDYGLAAYHTYPGDPMPATTTAPGRGGSISALTYTFDPIAPELGRNQYWQHINRLLGVEIELTYTPSRDYGSRFATTIAGGDLPDMVNVQSVQPRMPNLLAATFADLSDHLSGDAVLRFPALAATPTDAWRTVVYNGRLWGVPISRSPVGSVLYTRTDLLEQRGANPAPASYQEFVDMAVAVTDAKRSQWAFGDPVGVLTHVLQMNGIGNTWIDDDAGFSFAATQPQYEQALADTVALLERGVFHPDATAAQNTLRNEWMIAGTTCTTYGGYAGWGKYVTTGSGIDGFRLAGQVAPGRDGGAGVRSGSSVSAGFMALRPTDDPERINELLDVLNWLASPFGSTEYLARRFGQPGVHYALEGGDPRPTPGGQAETALPLRYLAETPPVLYEPSNPAATDVQYDYVVRASPQIVADPTIGLYSETAVTAGASALSNLMEHRSEILSRRQPVTSWAAAVATYLDDAGNDIKADYETAKAQR